MKKLVATLLIMVMSLSLLAGCGGSNDGDSNTGNTTSNEAGTNEDKEEEENAGGEVTMTYEVTDYETGNSMDCELTYNSSVLQRADEIFDDAEPVTSLTEGMAEFFHIETGASYAVIVIPHCGSAREYYSVDKDGYENNDSYKEVVISELTTEVVGDIETQTYTKKLVWEDDDTLDEQYWMLEFEDGVMIISTYGDEEELSIAQDSIKDLLVHVTLGGNEPKASGTTNDGAAANNDGTMPASDWLTPTIQIDGVEYTFPIEAQELVNNGWVMDDFPTPARPGANAGVYFTKGEMELFTNISSTIGAEQPIEEGEVCSMSFSSEYNKGVPVAFPGGIAIGSTKAEVESLLPSEFEYDADQQCFKYIYDDGAGKFDIKIYLSDDASVVEEISYTYWTR